MNIFFARHGETAMNAEKRMMGSRFDDGLNDEGDRQALELARSLEKDFQVLVSSPLKRALQTAEYIQKILNVPIEVFDEFKEFDGGLLSGMKWDKISELTGGKLSLEKIRSVHEFDFSEFGGESIETLRSRLGAGLDRLKNLHAGKKVLVVTHAGILRALYKRADKPLAERFGNASIVELEL